MVQQHSAHSDAPSMGSVRPFSPEGEECSLQLAPDPADARAKAWCLRLGMTSSAWAGYSRMHVNPMTAVYHATVSDVGFAFTCVYLATGLPFNHSWAFYAVTIPHLIYLVGLICNVCTFWRIGPELACHRLYPAVQAFFTVMGLPLMCVGFIGPLLAVPWNNRLKFVCVFCILTVLCYTKHCLERLTESSLRSLEGAS